MIWRKLRTMPMASTRMIKLLIKGFAQKNSTSWLYRIAAISATRTRKTTILTR